MRTINYLKIGLLLLTIAFNGEAIGQTYQIYLCDNGAATLQPNVTTPATIAATDTLVWTNVTTGTIVKKLGTAPNFDIPTNLSPGAYSYTVAIKSPAGCLGDPSAATTVYKLPAFATTLSTPSALLYCTNAATPTSTILATVTPAATLPSGVTFNYAWSSSTANPDVFSNAEGVIGADNSSTGTTNTFTMTTTTVGDHKLRTTVNYVVASGTFRSGDSAGCAGVSTNTQSVTVSPKPTQPTITIL
jgi:hypothetical protein